MTLARTEFRTQRVLALVDQYLPQAKHSNRTHTDWNVAGPALIARSAHSLRAIAALQPGQHHFDAGIILRTMFEHIATFAWLAADPTTRMPLWVRNDREQRLKADNDARSVNDPLLSDQLRQMFQADIDAVPSGAPAYPVLPDRARQADLHWQANIEHYPGPNERSSLRGTYRILYRMGSAFAHATPMGLDEVVQKAAPDTLVIGPKQPFNQQFNFFTIAPTVLGTGLLISGVTLGWPQISELNGAFQD